MNQSDSGRDPFCSSCHRPLKTAGSIDGECLSCWEAGEIQQELQDIRSQDIESLLD